jgi:hypothetical protein
MMRKPGNIGMEHTTINQLFYVHCTCRVDDIFAHLDLVREDRAVVEDHTRFLESVAERQRVKEVCNLGGYVRAVHEYFLKARPSSGRMSNQADGWWSRKGKQGVDDIGVGARRRWDNYNGH